MTCSNCSLTVTKYLENKGKKNVKVNLISGDVMAGLRALKAQPGKDIGMSGSGMLVRSLLDEGLLDELRLLVHPIVVGKGKRLFDESSEPRAFKLTHSAVSPAGLVHATYVRDGEVKTATVGGAQDPSPAELARREKLKREG